MEVYIIRNSDCGNGNDDSGRVLAVCDSEEKAKQLIIDNRKNPLWYGDVDIEGPFLIVETT